MHIQPDEPSGMNTEQRFKEALARYDPHEPSWFLGLDEASATLDLRGVDFIAWVKYPRRREPMPVPIQIKSSEGGRHFYFEKHPAAKAARVIVLVLNHKRGLNAVRSKLFAELAKVREQGVVYEGYLEKLRGRRVTRSGHMLIRHIEAKRSAQARTADTAHPPLRFLPAPLTRSEWVLAALRRFVRTVRHWRTRSAPQRTTARTTMVPTTPPERTSPAR